MQSLTKKLSNWSIGKPYWDWQWPLVLKVRKSILLRWWVVAGARFALLTPALASPHSVQHCKHFIMTTSDIWTSGHWWHGDTSVHTGHWTHRRHCWWRGGWSGLDFYDLASRGAVRWLACLVPRQVNIMELLHILHVATWPIMSTRREEVGWSRGEEDNLIMCNFDACTELFQTPLLRPAPPLRRKEHSPAQLAAKSHIGNRK